MKQFEQVWKYITVPISEATVNKLCSHNPPYTDGFVRERNSYLYTPITYRYSLGGFVPMIDATDPVVGILFEVHYDPTPMGKIAVSGIVPMKVGNPAGASVHSVTAGQWVCYAQDNMETPGLFEHKQGTNLLDYTLIGIALESGDTGDVVPVLLKEIPSTQWLGA